MVFLCSGCCGGDVGENQTLLSCSCFVRQHGCDFIVKGNLNPIFGAIFNFEVKEVKILLLLETSSSPCVISNSI